MNILITGASGMIGSNLAERLKQEGHFVVGVDIKDPDYTASAPDIFLQQDLTDQAGVKYLFDMCPKFDRVYNLAAVMGGMEYLAAGECDYKVLNESTLINWNVLDAAVCTGVPRVFFSSSACAYNMELQESADVKPLKEQDAYPVLCDLEYGYQKLLTERIHMAAERTTKTQVRIARYHNIYGKQGEWSTTKAKAPAAICRKVIQAVDGGSIDIIGDGLQTRSFTYIDDCIYGTIRLMESSWNQPLNIGSSEMVSINQLANMIIAISGKSLSINHIDGPQGVRGRNSDNTLCREVLNWEPGTKLQDGIEKLYNWIKQEHERTQNIPTTESRP